MVPARSSRKKTPAANVVELDDSLENENAAALLEQIKAALNNPEPLTLKADKVAAITTACMQVFCVAEQALQKREQKLIWENPSEYLLATASLLGVRSALGMPAE